MPSFKILYDGPLLEGRGAVKAMKQALDTALSRHRERFLPKHFTKAAINRYPNEYRNASRQRRADAFRTKLATMTEDQKREFFRERREKAKTKLSTADPTRQLPLVETGLLRASVLTGNTRFTGTGMSTRSMVLNVPAYTKLKRPNEIDKVQAIQAVISPEENAFARTVQRELETAIKRSNRKIRS